MNTRQTHSNRRIIYLPVPNSVYKTNQIVPTLVAPTGSIRIATNNNQSVANPIIKTTRAGKHFVEHQEAQRQSIHPNCYCHTRTYLAPHDDYFTCEDCLEVHHIHCDESPYEDILDTITGLDLIRCGYCHYQRYNTGSSTN